MVSTVQDRGYVSKETREGVERAYQKIEIIKGAISESTPVESTGAEKNKLFPTSVAYLLKNPGNTKTSPLAIKFSARLEILILICVFCNSAYKTEVMFLKKRAKA
jgi:hypothetical protein